MRLETVESVKSLSDGKKSNSIQDVFFNHLSNFLERHLGSEILVKIPSSLEDIDLHFRSPIEIADKLQKLGVILRVKSLEKFSDEPFLFCYQAVSSMGLFIGEGFDFFSKTTALQNAIYDIAGKYLLSNLDGIHKKCRIRSLYGKRKKTFFENFFKQNTEAEKRIENDYAIFSNMTKGLVVGKSYEESVVGGVLKLIGDDACANVIPGKSSPPLMDLNNLSEQDEELKNIIDGIVRYELNVHLLKLPNNFSLDVVMAIITDKTGMGTAFTVGISSDFDLKKAILNALSESLKTRLINKKKCENSHEIGNEKIIQKAADLFCDKKNLLEIEFLLSGDVVQVDLAKRFFGEIRDRRYYGNSLEKLTILLRKRNIETYITDISMRSLRRIGLNSILVMIPQLKSIQTDKGIFYP